MPLKLEKKKPYFDVETGQILVRDGGAFVDAVAPGSLAAAG